MIVFCLAAAALCVCKLKLGYNADYLNKERTTCVKGIFILLVFFSHFNAYVTFQAPLDLYYKRFLSSIGQAMVTPFLFYSGYGIMESIKRRQQAYVRTMPVNRIAGTLLRFDIAVCAYAVLMLLLAKPITLPQFLLSLTGWDAVGNSNWYIFDICVLYALTWLVFTLVYKAKRPPAAAVWAVAVLSGVFAVALMRLKEGSWWFDTVLCYPVGMLWSFYKEPIDRFLRSRRNWLAALIGSMVLTYLFDRLTPGKLFDQAAHVFYILSLVIASMRLSLANKVLYWLGSHLFELYILMRIPMILCSHFGLTGSAPYLAFRLCLAATVLLAWGYKIATDRLWNRLVLKKA